VADLKVVLLDEIRKKNTEAERELKDSAPLYVTKDGDGNPPGMNDRIGRIEGELSGVKRVQDITALAVVGVGAILISAIIYVASRVEQVASRVEQVNDRVIELPGKISTELQGITKTLSEGITAAKQQPPQVILIPTPQQPPNPPKP
jgi:hypothetical protein